jgi:hypothetical protein
MWNAFLTDFLQKYDFPAEGSKSLLCSFDQILSHSQLSDVLLTAVQTYESCATTQEAIMELLQRVKTAAAETDIPTEAVELLFFMLCMKPLKERFNTLGLSEDYYAGVARDLRSKLNECHAVRGIWGSFVAHWFPRFFVPNRFVMGRLQYELITIPEQYCTPETAHFANQPAINVHIPSGAPLRIEDVRASMQEAAKFYGRHFPGGNVPFVCNSWLLFPGHKEMLPESSGIRQFMEEFTLLNAYEEPQRQNLWRLFLTDNVWELDELPQDTSLQRAYVAWLKAGKNVGGGLGLRFIQT